MNCYIKQIRDELCYSANDEITPDDYSLLFSILMEEKGLSHPLSSKKINNLVQDIGLTENLFPMISAITQNQKYLSQLDIIYQERAKRNNAPYLRIAPFSVNPHEINNLMGNQIILGLLFGAESIYFQDTVHAYQNDAWQVKSEHPIRVLGINYSWLTKDNIKAEQALLLDEKGLVKLVHFTEPVSLDIVHILHLPQYREKQWHATLSQRCRKYSIPQINPYTLPVQRAENKYESYQLWKQNKKYPLVDYAVCFLRRGMSDNMLTEHIELYRKQINTNKLIVLPNCGTEGRLVKYFRIEALPDIPQMIDYIRENILPEDDCIVRPLWDKVKYGIAGANGLEYRFTTFRIHVLWNGEKYIAESGYAQISNDINNPMTSLEHGGTIIPLNTAFSNLYYHSGSDWIKLELTEQDIEYLKILAVGALESLQSDIGEEDWLKFAGVDIMFNIAETNLGNIRPMLLEINPRPAGLNHSGSLKLKDISELTISKELMKYIASEFIMA